MNLNDWYVNDMISRVERERVDSPHGHKRWLLEWRMTAPPRRPLAGWLGDRLVGIGERLRGWSAAADAAPVRARRAL